jgi:hypothetical protein
MRTVTSSSGLGLTDVWFEGWPSKGFRTVTDITRARENKGWDHKQPKHGRTSATGILDRVRAPDEKSHGIPIGGEAMSRQGQSNDPEDK